MSYDCRAVANAILDIADRRGVGLSHMAVHKVMYYAHGWRLATTGEPLIAQEFEAWRDGPVQRIVWDCFKHFGFHPVTARATRLDLVTRERTVVRENVASADLDLLDQVVSGYGHIDARELSRMTHEEGGPWDKVWNAPDGRITLGMLISHASS
jgi:uncharacterized phage-associated protein